MSIDSSADLLFKIGADSDDAEANLARFRTLLGKNLGDLGAEFDEWAGKVFGDLTTVKGAMIATGAALATAVVAAAGAAVEAAHKYSEFVDEIERGSRVTGLSAENMSRLKFAADVTHVSYDALVTGLTRFAGTIVKANDGAKEQAQAFARIGITSEQVKAGQKDMLPLLEAVADRFHAMGSQVEKTAIARDLFSRGGPALVSMLNQGSAAMKEMFEEAGKLGLVIGTADVKANEEYKESVHLMKSELEGLAVVVGRVVLPVLASAAAHIAGFVEAEREMAHTQATLGDYLTLGVGTWVKALSLAGEKSDVFREKMKALAESLSKFGDGQGDGLGAAAKEAKEEWSGLSDILQRVKEASEDVTSVDDRQAKALEKLQDEVTKASKKYDQLRAAGKLSAQDAMEQAAALEGMGKAFSALLGHMLTEISRKNQEATEDLQERLIAQEQQTTSVKLAGWDAEIAKLREKLEKQKSLTVENQELLAGLLKAGEDKINAEHADAVKKAGDAIEAKIAAQGEQTAALKRAQWDREIDEMQAAYAKEGKLTDAYVQRLIVLRAAGLAKIDAEEKAAGDATLARLGEQLQRVESEHETHAQRIVGETQAELAKYTAAEEKKTLTLATGEAQRAQIMVAFAALRKGLTDKEQADLQALVNSQGWQGVFGAKFAEAIRGNEALLKQWQTSTDQATLMVKVTLEGLKETAQKAFEGLAQGMGSNIASAVVYQKSIGEAMRQAVVSTLGSLASQALTYAIYSTGLGFLRLAQYDYVAADAAFTSAAIWGTVGAAAAVAGRFAVGGQQSGGGGSGGAAGGAGASGGGGVGSFGAEGAARNKDAGAGFQVGGTAANPGTHVTVNVQGHVIGTSGVEQLANMINDAVLNRNVQLTATNTKTGRQVQQ